jgi:PAS domain S-box-containing protein
MSSINSFLAKLIAAPKFSNEDDRRRRKKLNFILLLNFVAVLLILLGELLNDILQSGTPGSGSLITYFAALFLIPAIGVLYYINRHYSGAVAASLLVFLLTLVIPFADSLENVAFGRSLIAFTIPITLAAIILKPAYSYLAAAVSSLILTYISMVLLGAPLPNIPAIVIFFILAWLSHNAAVGLTKALKKLNLSYKKLQESELKYRGVFDGVNDAIIVETLSGDVVDVNERACEMFGWRREEFLQKNIQDMVPPESHKLIPDGESHEVLAEETLETINIRANGERFPVAVRGRIQELGGEKRLLVVVRDITRRKAEEQELIKAKEAAEVAAQAKTDFLANMSHEIRTPLNAIYGMTDLMLNTPLNAEQEEFVDTIRSGSDTLLRVVNDVLDFSKIEAGKMTLESAPFLIRECVEDTIDLLADKAAQKMLDLVYYVEEDVPAMVVGDLVRLRQVLMNLLNNGIKFTDKGEVFLNVRGMFVENSNYELKFSVRDTGIGIPQDRQDRLFKSFSQVDTSTTRKYGGTGLGLAISKELVEKMGGTLWLKSQEGEGSTFHFTILVGVEDTKGSDFSEKDISQLAGKRILIVDDNKTNRRILTRQTKLWQMESRAVASGAEALAHIQQGETYDIAILDMQMANMDGFTLAQEIAKQKNSSAFPLVILTSIKREKARAGDAKIAAFLTKPIKTTKLFSILLKLVTESPAPESKAKQAESNKAPLAENRPISILLVEDNRINQKVALKLLSHLGYTADLASNGVEALEMLRQKTYDVILMDIQMPEMDGEEATQRIRNEWDADKQPYIVAMTAHALEGDREKYLALGMDDYVSKPISVPALVAALNKVPR